MNKDIDEIINSFTWTFAKSMKNIPHEYTVKQGNLIMARDYETLYKYIKDNHYVKYFFGRPYKYCDIGEYTYWIMTDDIRESRIINRCKRVEK